MVFCNKCGSQVPEGAAYCQSCGSPVQAASPGVGGSQQAAPTTGLSRLLNERAAQDYWVKRLLAFVVDAVAVYIVIGILVAAAALPAYFAGLLVPGSSTHIAYLGGFFGTIANLLFVLYFTFAEASYGKSLGKMVMGLQVSTDSGQRPSLGSSFLRNLSKINWVLLLLDVVVGLALDTGYLKKFSDRFLGTKVS
jgi:uncharacterized RDD family membrane protein YckC